MYTVKKILNLAEREFSLQPAEKREEMIGKLESELIKSADYEARYWASHSKAALELQRRDTEQRLRLLTIVRINEMRENASPIGFRADVVEGKFLNLLLISLKFFVRT